MILIGFWLVVEVCSGICYLIVLLMVGIFFVYLIYNFLKKCLIFIVIFFIVLIVVNWFCVYFIVMFGYLFGNKFVVGVDYLIYGWVFFGIVIGVMFVVGVCWSDFCEEILFNVDLFDGMVKWYVLLWLVVIFLIGIIFVGLFVYDWFM